MLSFIPNRPGSRWLNRKSKAFKKAQKMSRRQQPLNRNHLEALEPRCLLSAVTATDLNGTWNLFDYLSNGTVVLNPTNATTGTTPSGGGSFVNPGNGDYSITGGSFTLGTNGLFNATVVTTDNFGGYTLEYTGGTNEDGDFLVVNEIRPSVPTASFLIRTGDDTYTNADYAGTWNVFHYAGSGTITLDASGNITGGQYALLGSAAENVPAGTYTNQNGGASVFNLNLPGEPNGSYRVRMSADRDVAIMQHTSDTNDGNASPYLLIKTAGTYNTADFAGTWQLMGDAFAGSIILNSSGQVTGGSYVDEQDDTYNFTGGSFSIDTFGNITGTVTSTHPQVNNNPFSGVLGGDRDIAGLVGRTNNQNTFIVLTRGEVPDTTPTWATFAGTALTITGTAGNDSLTVTRVDSQSRDEIRIARNGEEYIFANSAVSSILFEAGAGTDTVVVTGGLQADTAKLYANGSVAFFGDGYTVTATGAEVISVNGSGNDMAEFYDSAGSDTFVAFPTYSRMTGTGFSNTASGFGDVRAFAENDGADDFAEIYDTDGDNHTRHFPAFTDMAQSGGTVQRYVYAQNFDRINAYSTSGSATAGGDFVEFWDSTGRDTFQAYPDFAVMSRVDGGTGALSRYASNFQRYNAYSDTSIADLAEIYDTNGNDTFKSFPNYSDMSTTGGDRNGRYVYVGLFEQVNTYAIFGNAGGTDFAEFYDTDGTDRFRSFREFSDITAISGSNNGLYRYASGYSQVNSYAVNGGPDDLAELYDTTGNDNLRAFEAFVDMSTTGFYRYVSSYERVNSYAVNGGTDFAEIYDTAGNDTFRGMPTFSDMSTEGGLYRYVGAYEKVNSYRVFGGTDTATLFDSSGNDLFVGRSNFGQLVGTGFELYASGYNPLTINGSAGGTNTKDVAGISYTLNEVGVWV